MRDPNPTVVLIPGLGMIAWGKNKSESRVTAEFYNCAIEVMRGAEAIDRYEAMDAAGGLRHRVLVARGGQAPAPAAREGARPADRRGRGRRRRHRQGHRPPAGRRRARTSCAWTASRGGAQETAGEIVDRSRRGHRSGRHRDQQLRARRSASAATSPTATSVARDARARSCSPTAASTRWSSPPASSCRPTATGRIEDEQWALTFGVNVTGRLHRGRRGEPDLPAAGPARERGAHHQRQRGGGEEGQPRLRHQQGRGQPPGARAGGRDGAARPGQRAWRRPPWSRAARCSRATA